jgi:hypothetical protein
MLNIKDLRSSNDLDSKEMSGVVGGSGYPGVPLLGINEIFAPSNQFATQTSISSAFTGPQSNVTHQGDNDVIHAGYGAQVTNTGGNYSTSNNSAHVTAVSAPYLSQF